MQIVYIHLRRLNKCTATLFIIAYNASKSENEERKTTKYLQSACCLRRCWQFWETRCSHAKRVLIGWFLYLSGWFVKGKKCLLKKKITGLGCSPCIFATQGGGGNHTNPPQHFAKTLPIFKKKFWGSLCLNMGHTYCPVCKISKYLVLCTRDVTISCYGLAHISGVQVNFELLSTKWVKKLGANQAVCAFCFHAQCCILKREVVSVYFVTTINTKKKLSESKIHKNGQKCFFVCVCVSSLQCKQHYI